MSYQLLKRLRCKKDGKHLLEDITGEEHTESLQQLKATKTTEGQPDRLPLITDPNIKQLPEICCGNKLKKCPMHFDGVAWWDESHSETWDGDVKGYQWMFPDDDGNYDKAFKNLRGRNMHKHTEAVSYTHLRAHETDSYLVCRLLLEKKKT